jgi:hypothetical protein
MQSTWIYTESGFRMARTAEVATSETGRMRLCESYEGGRWEPFYTYEAEEIKPQTSKS